MTTHSNLWASASSKLSEEDRRCINFDGQDKISILTGLQSLTNTAKSEAINNRWRIRRARRGGETETVVIHDLFRKIAVWIDRFKGTGDIVVQYDPVHAALPWAGVRFLLEVVTYQSANTSSSDTIYPRLRSATLRNSILLSRAQKRSPAVPLDLRSSSACTYVLIR